MDSWRCGRSERPHHAVEETVEGAVEVVAAAGVDGGGLDDRAARSDEPVEALAQRQLAIAPAAAPPAHTAAIASSALRIAPRSSCGSSARRRASSTAKRAAR
jgi:hypothetical protein